LENRIGALAYVVGHFQEDAVNLGLLLVEQADQFVVLLDGFEGLDEDGLAAGARAVDYALNAALLFDFDGDYETLATDGDQFVLHCAVLGKLAQITSQRFLNLALLFFDFAADAGEFGRGAIFEGAVGLELVAESAEEAGEVYDGGGKLGYAGPSCFHGGGRVEGNLAPLGGAVDQQDNVADFQTFEYGSGNAGFFN